MKTNKIIRSNEPMNLAMFERAVKGGALSFLITETEIRVFAPTAIVVFPSIDGKKMEILAENLRRNNIPFASEIEALRPTIKIIPAAHLRGEQDVPKVYPARKEPAVRPVVTPVPEAPPAAPAAAEPAAPAQDPVIDIPGVTPVEEPKKKGRKGLKGLLNKK